MDIQTLKKVVETQPTLIARFILEGSHTLDVLMPADAVEALIVSWMENKIEGEFVGGVGLDGTVWAVKLSRLQSILSRDPVELIQTSLVQAEAMAQARAARETYTPASRNPVEQRTAGGSGLDLPWKSSIPVPKAP